MLEASYFCCSTCTANFIPFHSQQNHIYTTIMTMVWCLKLTAYFSSHDIGKAKRRAHNLYGRERGEKKKTGVKYNNAHKKEIEIIRPCATATYIRARARAHKHTHTYTTPAWSSSSTASNWANSLMTMLTSADLIRLPVVVDSSKERIVVLLFFSRNGKRNSRKVSLRRPLKSCSFIWLFYKCFTTYTATVYLTSSATLFLFHFI